MLHVRKKDYWPKAGEFVTFCSNSLSQSIERGRISREGAVDFRESRYRRDKILPNSSSKKRRKNAIFWPENLHYLSRIACHSRKSRSA